MCTTRVDTDYLIRTEYFLGGLGTHPTIQYSLEWMCLTRKKIEDHIRNDEFLVWDRLTIDFIPKEICVVCDNVVDHITNE